MEVKQGANVIPLPLKSCGSRAAILDSLKKQVDEKTDFLFEGLTENIADALFEEMDQTEDQSTRNHHFNIMRAMKVDEHKCRDKFNQLVSYSWATFMNTMDTSHIAMPSGDVATQITSLSCRVEIHYKVLISEIRHRFQTLLNRDIGEHPLLPELYYRTFWQALFELGLSHGERSCLLLLFHRFVMDRYGQILTVANRTLIELKVEKTLQLPTSSQ